VDAFIDFVRTCAVSLALTLAVRAQSPASEPASVPPPAPLPSAPLAGELPADASPEARQAWKALCAATAPETAEGGVRPRVRAFDLVFDGTLQSGGTRSNDFETRYRYLEPGFVRMSLASGRERLRGPRGDFVIESGRPVKVQGREMAEDLRELEETVAIAKCFAGLTDPRSLRLSSLELRPAAPRELPAAVGSRNPSALRWLSIVSPDLQRSAPRAPPTSPTATGTPVPSSWRAHIGLDPTTHLPVLALVAQDDRGTLVLETALLVELDKYRALDGFRVPAQIKTYLPDAERSPWAFAERPAMKLWMVKGTLRPELSELDFVPR